MERNDAGSALLDAAVVSRRMRDEQFGLNDTERDGMLPQQG